MNCTRSIFLLLMLSAPLAASQFCASDGTENPPVWNEEDMCTADAYSKISVPPIRNVSSAGSNFIKHDCSIAVILDLDQRLTSEQNYGNVLLFIKGMVGTCMIRGIGYRSYFYSMFNSNNTQTICCEEKACGYQIAFMDYNDNVGTYSSMNTVQDDPANGNFTYALLGDLKAFASKQTKCLYNNVVLLTQRVFNYQDGLPEDIKQVVNFGCISFTIIAVGNPAITNELLENSYKNLTTNLYSVPDFNCLPNLDQCIKPCGPKSFTDCESQELTHCPPPTSHTVPTTTDQNILPLSTESSQFADFSHFIYLFALSNRTTQDQFNNAINYVLDPLRDCLSDKDKILVRFLARDNSDSNWLDNYNSIKNHLESLRSEEVLLDASRAIDVYENTTLQLVRRAIAIPISQNLKIGEPKLTLLTDFASQNFIDALHTDESLIRSLGRFDFEIYCFDTLAADIYKNETYSPAHVHSDPDFSNNKNEEIQICSKKSKASFSTIMFIVIGACAGVVLLLVIVTILYRRKYIWMEKIARFRNNVQNTEEEVVDEELEFDYYELSEEHLIVKNELAGRGVQGSVNIAKLIGYSPAIAHYLPEEKDRFTDVECVVKLVPLAARETFLKEINIMKHIGYHDHIVTMLGCITSSTFCKLVLEFCPFKDLLKFVKQSKLDIDTTKSIDETWEFTKKFLTFSHQITQGMEYLGEKKVVHRDLAARNILITGVGDIKTAKISDFGLALKLDSDKIIAPNDLKLPIKWTALEALARREFSVQTDIWSFGMLLYEMYSWGESPFKDIDVTDVANHLQAGNRPIKPLLANDRIGEMMVKCWHENPSERPSFRELEAQFATQLEQATEGYGYLALVKSDEHYRILPSSPPPPAPEIRRKEIRALYADEPCRPYSASVSSQVLHFSIDANPHVPITASKRKRSHSHVLPLEIENGIVHEDHAHDDTGLRSALRRRKSQIAALNPFKKIIQFTKTSVARKASEP